MGRSRKTQPALQDSKMTTGIDTEAREFYQEVPDHLVDLCTAAEEYGVPIWRLRKWVFRGRLAKHGRLIARAPGGGSMAGVQG